MKFLLDEDVAWEVARCLQLKGFEIELVFEVLGGSTSDEDVWRYAVSNKAIIVTCNRTDFLQLAGTRPDTGLIILNRRHTRHLECTNILKLIERAGENGLINNINFA